MPTYNYRKSKVSNHLIVLSWLLVFITFTGCSDTSEKSPDVSGVKISLKTYRFDKDIFAIDTNQLAAGLQKLNEKYPDFLNYYLDTIKEWGIHGNYSDTVKGIREDLRLDLTFKDFVNLQDSILKYYPDSKETDDVLTRGFQYIKYYFSDYTVPRIFYLNMGLSKWPTFPVDKNTLCVGLDMFLGPQFPYYRAVGIPDYMDTHLTKEYLPVSLFSVAYKTIMPPDLDNKPLLDLMIQRGKEQYFLHKILPGTTDEVLFGFTDLQMKWCNANEAVVYNYFIHENLLYNKEAQNTMPYIHDGPYAKGLESSTEPVKKTPGNIGTWLGYKIVSAYMAQYPKTTLKELVYMKMEPTQFLDKAKYRPK